MYKTGGGTFDFVIGLEPPFTSIDQRVYIHKAIVAAASPVLRELIANSAGEWNFNLHAAKEDYGVVEAKQFKQLIEVTYLILFYDIYKQTLIILETNLIILLFFVILYFCYSLLFFDSSFTLTKSRSWKHHLQGIIIKKCTVA